MKLKFLLLAAFVTVTHGEAIEYSAAPYATAVAKYSDATAVSYSSLSTPVVSPAASLSYAAPDDAPVLASKTIIAALEVPVNYNFRYSVNHDADDFNAVKAANKAVNYLQFPAITHKLYIPVAASVVRKYTSTPTLITTAASNPGLVKYTAPYYHQ